MEGSENALVPTTNANGNLDFTGMLGGLLTSLPAGSIDEKLAVAEALDGTNRNLSECVGDEILIAHILAHTVHKSDKQTGEIVPLTRTVLIDPEGTMFEAKSAGIVKSLRKLMFVYGAPPWNPPIRVKVKEIKTSDTNKMLHLEIVKGIEHEQRTGKKATTPRPSKPR